MPFDVSVTTTRLNLLRSGAVIVSGTPAIFQVQGPGALTCLQGLLTQDLDAPGPDTLVYGAVLTPKGMIVADLWVVREAPGFLLLADASARAALAGLLGKSLPPRLARVTDLSDDWRASWLLGAAAPEKLARALGHDIPGAGKALRLGPAGLILAGGTAAAPFRVVAIGPAEAIAALEASFLGGSGHRGDEGDLIAARVLAGWPTLGREIDEKSLPQEVRFEEIGGVSYTKGCYTGQETVARIHFRGHVNRLLRGVVLQGVPGPGNRALTSGDKEVGRLATILILPDRVLGLAMLRREVEEGSRVWAGDQEAKVIALPIASEAFAA